MDPRDAACEEAAARRHGVLDRSTARRAGLSDTAIRRRVASGRWRRILPGVYLPRPVPIDWRTRAAAAVLWGGPGSMLSHSSAAALWALDGFEERWTGRSSANQRIEIYVRAGRSAPWVIAHRLRPGDLPISRSLDGIPATSVERTILDLTARGVARAERALDDALRRRLTSLPGLWAELAATGARGRAGTSIMRALLEERGPGDDLLESLLETRLLRLIRRAGLPEPVPQFEVRAGRKYLARVDFAYPKLRLALEADGHRWHSTPRQLERDRARGNRLVLAGWTVLRFSWTDAHRDGTRVVREIRAALTAAGNRSADQPQSARS